MSAYCVQLKDETAEHKIYPRTLAHCVVDEEGTDILSLMKDLLGDTSLTFNELLQEASKTPVSPSVFSDLIKLLAETHIDVYYSSSQPTDATLGSLWYDTANNVIRQKTGNSYTVRDHLDMRDALRVVNHNFSRPRVTIHLQERSPLTSMGDLWVTDTVKQFKNEIPIGLGWHTVTNPKLGGKNLLRYTREYDPSKYDKWVDRSRTPVTSEVYQVAQGEFGVQRVDRADASVSQSVKLEPGTYYCMSAYVKSERSDVLATLRGVVDTTYAMIETSNFTQGGQIGTEYQRIYFVFRTYSTCTYLMPRFTSSIDHPYLIYGLQLEKGIEPTDWTPNPQDILEKIKECRFVCRSTRTLYYTAPISSDFWSLAYDKETSKVSEYYSKWSDITSKNLISAFEYLNAKEEYQSIKAYSQEEMPSTHSDGDIWLELSTEKLYQWDDSDDIWSEVNTEILPTVLNKIRTALKSTSELSGKLSTELGSMNVRIEKINEAVQEISPEAIIQRVTESSAFKDPETGLTLMERMKSAEQKITDEAIVQTVKDNTSYDQDISDIQDEVKEAKQEITADSIMQKVSNHETYKKDLGDISDRLNSAEQKITPDAIIQTVKTQVSHIDKLGTTVTTVQVEYYLADPSYTPTGNETTGWSTNVTWSSDKYVWSRTVNTLIDGSKIYSTPTCISGSSDGLTIVSIEPQYCSYTSETEAPPQDHGGWVDSSDTSGTETGGDTTVKMYTWSRSKITYSDDSVAYSDPYYDISLNRLSDIEEHYSTQITQLSDSIESKVSKGDLDTMMKLELDGLHLKKSDSSNEVVIDEDSVDIRTGGTTYSSFGTGYVQFGNYTIREGKDGGLVFVYDKK